MLHVLAFFFFFFFWIGVKLLGNSESGLSVHHMFEPEMFLVTSLSHNHLTPIIGLLLFIYFPWQANRAEVTHSRRSLLRVEVEG